MDCRGMSVVRRKHLHMTWPASLSSGLNLYEVQSINSQRTVDRTRLSNLFRHWKGSSDRYINFLDDLKCELNIFERCQLPSILF